MKNQNLKINHFSRLSRVLLSLFCWLLPLQTQAQHESGEILTLSPEKCVALRQGQTCYVDIKLNWKAEKKADYCLFASNREAPLQCWEKSDNGELSMEFSSNENTWFYLKRQQETLAQVELKMAWVYKSKRSSVTWRVF